MEQEKLRQIAYKVLQETLILSRNVLFFPEDTTSVKYVQEIIDAIHNIPDSIQNGNEKILDFELELLLRIHFQKWISKVCLGQTSNFSSCTI